jgi:hypothetical protein
MKTKETNLSEPYYYIALVLKGSEKQYLNLLKYVGGRNGAQMIYQCKSLTYLHVSRDDGVKIKAAEPLMLDTKRQQKGETR